MIKPNLKLRPIVAVLLSISFYSNAGYAVEAANAQPTNSVSGQNYQNLNKRFPRGLKHQAQTHTEVVQNSKSNAPQTKVDASPKVKAQPVKVVPSKLDIANNQANTAASMGDDKVVLNFDNADIQSVIKAISKLSGKNFVIDPRVKGTVNIVSDKPISKADSYKVLASALRMQGFSSVEADGVIKVLPETDAKTYGMKTFGGSQYKNQQGDQVITKIFIIERGSATQISNALRPLVAPNNSISVYPNSNALIVTDYASNMARISRIISQLSTNNEKTSKPVFLTLKNAVASDVAQTLQAYIQGGGSSTRGGPQGAAGGGDSAPPVSITVDPLTNSLIIDSLVATRTQEIRELAEKLDRDVGQQNNQLHVVYLKNADAGHVADVLRVLTTGQENPDIKASSDNVRFTSEPSSMFANSGGGSGGSSLGSGGGGGLTSARSTSSKGSSTNANNANKDGPKVIIQAEPSTNSLIIQAPDAIYKNLRNVIDMLDIRRAQVMIEAMIATIKNTTTGSFGIQWLTGAGNNNAGVVALSNYGGTPSGQTSSNGLINMTTGIVGAAQALKGGGGIPAAGAGGAGGLPSFNNELYLGLVTGTATIGGQTVPTLGALADMISANSVGNILSRPTLITMDNEEAKIMVGQNIGVPSGSFQNTTGIGSAFNTVNRQDLGMVLQIKPLITQSGAIRLEIYQENSVLDPDQPANSANGPSFSKQFMRDSLLVDDGQIIAIGGMTEDSISLQNNGIPGLMDIPYLGWLFSWQSRAHQKRNIVLFLRPVIIRNEEGYKALTSKRYNYIVNEQDQAKGSGNLMLPTIKPVNMDNQVPYNDVKMPPQPSNLVTDLPIVDMRASTRNNGNSTANSGSVNKVSGLSKDNSEITIRPLKSN